MALRSATNSGLYNIESTNERIEMSEGLDDCLYLALDSD